MPAPLVFEHRSRWTPHQHPHLARTREVGMKLAELSIFLFGLGEAIFPSRPQFDCTAVSSGGQGWPPLGGHPKGLSLTVASTVAGFVTRGENAIITAWDFLLPF